MLVLRLLALVLFRAWVLRRGSRTSGLRRVESDTVFKASVSWDFYRGGLRSATDFKRVA